MPITLYCCDMYGSESASPFYKSLFICKDSFTGLFSCASVAFPTLGVVARRNMRAALSITLWCCDMYEKKSAGLL